MPNALRLPPALPHARTDDAGAPAPPTATPTGVNAADAADALAARLVRPGDGRRRCCAMTHRERAATVFRAAGLALAGLVLGVPLVLPLLLVQGAFGLVGRLCRAVAADPGGGATGLAAPVEQALLRERAGGIDPKTMAWLHAYAAKLQTPLTPRQITQLVRAGQTLALALRQPLKAGADPHTVHIEGHAVRCNAWLARALMWYLMAVAAAQDTAAAASSAERLLDRRMPDRPPAVVSDMVTNGSLVMRDPDRRLYRFLRGCALAHPRPSTHFASRSATAERFRWLGLFAGASPQQYGIEDMSGRFPGGGGALLFDTLRGAGADGAQLFVKFEKAGWPALLLRDEPSLGKRAAYSIEAVHRNLAHLTNFVTTRFDCGDRGYRIERMEHVHRGGLKPLIYQPFMALIEDAIRGGLIAAEYRSIVDGVESHGLPFVAAAVDALYDIARATAATEEGGNAKGAARQATAERIRQATVAFGAVFDRVMDRFGVTLPGVERFGAEVHLDLDWALSRVDRSPSRGTDAGEAAPEWHVIAWPGGAPV